MHYEWLSHKIRGRKQIFFRPFVWKLQYFYWWLEQPQQSAKLGNWKCTVEHKINTASAKKHINVKSHKTAKHNDCRFFPHAFYIYRVFQKSSTDFVVLLHEYFIKNNLLIFSGFVVNDMHLAIWNGIYWTAKNKSCSILVGVQIIGMFNAWHCRLQCQAWLTRTLLVWRRQLNGHCQCCTLSWCHKKFYDDSSETLFEGQTWLAWFKQNVAPSQTTHQTIVYLKELFNTRLLDLSTDHKVLTWPWY